MKICCPYCILFLVSPDFGPVLAVAFCFPPQGVFVPTLFEYLVPALGAFSFAGEEPFGELFVALLLSAFIAAAFWDAVLGFGLYGPAFTAPSGRDLLLAEGVFAFAFATVHN